MNSSQTIILIVVIVVVAAVAYIVYRTVGTRVELRRRFGREYDRVVAEKGGRAAGEAELRRRLKEHDAYRLREVNDDDRTRYRESWIAVQKEFVDNPAAAVRDAERLVSVFAADRGYPAANYGDRIEQLSVEHASALDHYRSAHDISVVNDAGDATTEELRQALVHYRDLFTNLIGADLKEPALATNQVRDDSVERVAVADGPDGAETTADADDDAALRETVPTVPQQPRADEDQPPAVHDPGTR